MCSYKKKECNLFQNIAGFTKITTTVVDYEKIPFVCKTFKEMMMTEGIHMLKITISLIKGISIAECIQKKSHMIDRHRDYVTLILHFQWLYPLSVCVSVCLSPHNSAIFQPVFRCDTWLDASFPRAGYYVDHLMNYTKLFEKNDPKVFMIVFLCWFSEFLLLLLST